MGLVSKQLGLEMEWAINGYSPGEHFFVDNSNLGHGLKHHFATISQALAACKSYRGDVIHVMAGHSEDVIAAGGLDIDKACVTIIGHGGKSTRPSLKLNTAATATIDITAPDVTIENFDILADLDAIAVMIDVMERGFALRNCRVGVTDEAYNWLVGVQATSTAASSLTIDASPYKGLTSATAVFTQDMVGRSLYVVSGTNAVTGWHTITAVAADGKSLDTGTAVGTGAGTDVVVSIPVADRMVIDQCQFESRTAGATEGIEIVGCNNNITIQDCIIDGSFSVAAISAITAPSYGLNILRNQIKNAVNQAAGCVDLVAGCVGFFSDNRGHCGNAAATDVDSLCSNENYFNAALTFNGTLDPATS